VKQLQPPAGRLVEQQGGAQQGDAGQPHPPVATGTGLRLLEDIRGPVHLRRRKRRRRKRNRRRRSSTCCSMFQTQGASMRLEGVS